VAYTIDMNNGEINELEYIAFERRQPKPESIERQAPVPVEEPGLAVHTFEETHQPGLPDGLADVDVEDFLDDMEGPEWTN